VQTPNGQRTSSRRPLARGRGLRRLGSLLLTLSFLTISWNAVRIEGFEPGQILLAVAVAILGLDALGARRTIDIPTAMLVGALLIASAGLLCAVFPVSPSYIGSRFNPISPTTIISGGNLAQLAKFEVALIGVILAVLLLRPTITEARRLTGAWAISALISAAVAASDASGHTNISARLLGFIDSSGRQAGLTEQANHLAVSMAIVVPVLLYWILHGRARTKIVGALALGLVTYGSLLAGSRGGFAGMLFAVAFFVLLTPRLRLPALLFGIPLLAFAACVAVLAFPSVVTTVATDIRLAGNLGAVSDVAHLFSLQQGLLDVQQSPIYGIGFQVINGATEVHLQLLAAGGVLALVGYLVYWFTVLRAWFAARHIDEALATALVTSILTFLFLNFVESQVADTYLYVPAAILVSLAAAAPREVVRKKVAPRRATISPLRASAPRFAHPRSGPSASPIYAS
jgi:hypothetical protein